VQKSRKSHPGKENDGKKNALSMACEIQRKISWGKAEKKGFDVFGRKGGGGGGGGDRHGGKKKSYQFSDCGTKDVVSLAIHV